MSGFHDDIMIVMLVAQPLDYRLYKQDYHKYKAICEEVIPVYILVSWWLLENNIREESLNIMGGLCKVKIEYLYR